MIKDIRRSAQNTVLVLDAGNTLFGQRLATESEGRIIVEAMNAMGYDAMAVGEMDLYKGIDVLMQRAKEAQFTILSCNIVSQKGKPLFTPYTILQRNGVRYGIMGVSGFEFMNTSGVRDMEILDPIKTVQKYLPEVSAKSDVVILLSQLGLEADMALAQTVPGIHIIVGGKSRYLLDSPQVVGQTVIVQAGYDGEWLGRLDVRFDSQGRPIDPRVQIISLGPEIADDPALTQLVASYN